MTDITVKIVKHNELQTTLCIKNLPYTYFDLTVGDGACFCNAICEAFSIPFCC